MDTLVDECNKFAGTKARLDDDVIDRLSSRYTVILILLCAALVTFQSSGSGSISCWAPVHFTGSHTKFATSYCWVKNTYYLPWDKEIPREGESDESRRVVTYYQWMPFILLLQALLFYMPSLLWHGLNSKSGVDSDSILACAGKLHKADDEESREAMLQLIARQMDRFLGHRVQVPKGKFSARRGVALCCSVSSRRNGAYLVCVYLCSKILYIANAIGQLFILSRVLGVRYGEYGLGVLRDGLPGDHDWHRSPQVAFPRVTMCDFNIRRLGNVHRYALQCALPLNLWNEKIFTILWFWIVLVAAVSILGFLIWCLRVFYRADQSRYISGQLARRRHSADVKGTTAFTEQYLRQDGVLILRLIAHNTNQITTADIICTMWDIWFDRKQGRTEKDLVELEQ